MCLEAIGHRVHIVKMPPIYVYFFNIFFSLITLLYLLLVSFSMFYEVNKDRDTIVFVFYSKLQNV